MAVNESDLNEITDLYDEAGGPLRKGLTTHDEKLSWLFDGLGDLHQSFDDLEDEIKRLGRVAVEQQAEYDEPSKEFKNLSIVDKPKEPTRPNLIIRDPRLQAQGFVGGHRGPYR